ncbi:S8 family serine peptidase, partial [Chloroflexota bacterium]
MLILKIKRALGIIVILALVIDGGVPFLASMSPAVAQSSGFESFNPELTKQLAEIYQQKQALTPGQRKIDSSIIRVIGNVEKQLSLREAGERLRLQNLSTSLLRIDDTGNIEVKLTVTSLADEKLRQLEDLGMDIGLTLPDYGVLEGSLPHSQVEAVAGLDFVVNLGLPGYPLYHTGDVSSAGDMVLRAAEARSAFTVHGSGIKIGAISDGITHLSDSQASGDLPTVDVIKAGSGDEGTAMLEIVHDLAAGSPLAFYSPGTSSDMVAGIAALEASGCKIIIDDILWSDEPKFEDGPIALEARQFITNGGVYVSSAGNSAQRHYMGTYVRGEEVTVSTGGNDYDYYAHDYGSGDIGNTFTVPNGGTIVTLLQWNNQRGLSRDDFDLFLITGSTILNYSWNQQDGDDNPFEGFIWTNNTGGPVTVYIVVLEWSLVNPPSSLVLDYHVWYGSGLQYTVPENSVIGHSAVEEVLSTAAAGVGTPHTIESFSSHGPATVYFPTYENRQVPNITGVDGVHTKTGELGHFVDPFYGTSASAPHVAAIAALIWEADPTLTSSEVFNAITSTAVDLGPAGWDDTW